MQYGFLHLFPVIIALTALIMDLRTAKVDNGWILFSMGIGLFVCIWEKGVGGAGFYLAGTLIPLLLTGLFVFGMLGAGDIKLFCALGGVIGSRAILKCILVSFFTGACISVALLIFHCNICNRFLYLIKYTEHFVLTGEITPYRRKEITAPENFHFTIPIFISILLYAGGFY